MRRLGYGEHRGGDGQYSYARRVSGAMFPRYHVYVEQKENGMTVSLHVDQKAPSYEGTHAHAGEYEGQLVEREMKWIASQIEKMKQAPVVAPEEQKPKKRFWGLWI